ncbi:hypothetical protein HD554DRAFT_2020862 [Boletus coccyginus]|nr:hypothetical protein HD554DRAFT_2020862 [Boletus coccyginus]
MPSYLQRKYIDLIRQVSSKWVNWDPPIGVQVGAYGTVDKETGDLIVEGNIYDPAFQKELDKHNSGIRMADFPPQEGPAEDDFVISSRGAKRGDVDNSEVCVAGIAHASVKGQWSFERGKRGALLIMHSPRQIFLPPKVVLEPLYKVDKLVDRYLVTSIHVCPAYSMYLSDKSGDKVSLALVSQTPITTSGVAQPEDTNGGFTWWVDAPAGLLRKACDQTGNSPFTPLFALRRPIKRIRRFFRDKIEPEPSGDELWFNESVPWDPLDEDGVEDPFDPVSGCSCIVVVGFSLLGISGDPSNRSICCR